MGFPLEFIPYLIRDGNNYLFNAVAVVGVFTNNHGILRYAQNDKKNI
jgi:hypothetical protein